MAGDLDLTEAAIAACRAVWKSVRGGDFDADCPDRERWIREELEALEPAAPIIARQLAEKIAERIEQQVTLTTDRRDDYLPDAQIAGFLRGLRSASRIAREVGSGG